MSVSPPINVFWFRRDFNLDDNAGLRQALQAGLPVQCIFIFDKNILDKLEDKDDPRVSFIYQQVGELKRQLEAWGSTLEVFYDKPQKVFEHLIQAWNIRAVFTNTDYETYARERDDEVEQILKQAGARFLTFKNDVIFEKDEVLKSDGSPYTVFTPYSKKWKEQLAESAFEAHAVKPLAKHLLQAEHPAKLIQLKEMGFVPASIQVPAGNASAELLRNYKDLRDFPAKDATSHMSVHLRFGTVSIRQLARKGKAHSEAWLNELIWRDFYKMILWHFPHVERKAFKPEFENVRWRNNEEEFKRWCEGTTGYPLVDAGMRQLNATGFMHNRVRMVTASFLVKHLLIDWRWGEAYFARKLLDFELSSNNGGWQWAAGTGCDAAPYFRVFNPSIQFEKFDPKASYVRQWVPEFGTGKYPKPLVDHKLARERALAAYKEAR